MAAETWITLIAVCVSTIGIVAAGIWQLGKSRTEILVALEKSRIELEAKIDQERREFSETISAIRQKINDVELESYKVFVRRESFLEMIKSLKEAIEARLDKQEAKLDRVIERIPPNLP